MNARIKIATLLLITAAPPALGMIPRGSWTGPSSGAATPPRQRTQLPLVYKNKILIISTKDGVAAFFFGDDIEYGVKYKYKLLRTGADKVETGEDQAFVKYERMGKPVDPHSGGTFTQEVGHHNFIAAGPISVDWAYDAKGQGIISYYSDDVKIQTVDISDIFDKLDLKQYAK